MTCRVASDAPARGPDFFVVGHPKSGTTALYDMLRQHPQVYMSPVKEPQFFVAAGEIPQRTLRPRSLADYLALFSGAEPGQLAGEATPTYLRSKTAASGIAAHNPAARVIAILREPTSFVRSSHLQCLRAGVEEFADLRTALAEAPTRPPWLRYADHVRYVEQIQRYHAVFPAEQVLVLIYDDYRDANLDTVRQIFRFLGLDDDTDLTPSRVNGTKGVRSVVAAATLRRLQSRDGSALGTTGRVLVALTPAVVRSSARRLYRRVNSTSPPPLDEALMAELRYRFGPEVRRLSDHLGRDLCALWGYPAS
jgi:hypothetical protein